MTKKEYYELELGQSDDWTAYLLKHSNMPGPRINMDLMEAFVEMGSENDFLPLLDYTEDVAPPGTAEEYLAFCGTVGLGELIAGGLKEFIPDLQRQAEDPRPRIREAVKLARGIIHQNNPGLLP